MEINFFSEDIDFTLAQPAVTSNWLNSIAQQEDAIIDSLNYIFCSDDYLHNINLEYLDHDTYTDIITFDQSEDDTLCGDIFISIDRVRDNATSMNTQFSEELHRVIAHGLLHLIGYKDKTTEEAALMREKEEACLTLLPG